MNLLEQIQARINGILMPATSDDGTYADGWQDCRSAILKVLQDTGPTVNRELLVKIGVSDIPTPMNMVKRGDMYRIFDRNGKQIDPFVRQADGDATVDENGVVTIPHYKIR